MRLINAEELPLEPCESNIFISKDYAFGWNDMLRQVLKAERIEVEPVRHGHWERTADGAAWCSACKRKMNPSQYGYAYCSLCGARMDDK